MRFVSLFCFLLFSVATTPTLATFAGHNGPIVFQVSRSGSYISAAQVVPGEAHRQIYLSGSGYKVDMYYAPDGQRVVYTVFDAFQTTKSSLRITDLVRGDSASLQIPPVPISTTYQGTVYTTDFYPRHPSFTPDGRSVVFSQAGHIRLYNLDTENITDLTTSFTEPHSSRSMVSGHG